MSYKLGCGQVLLAPHLDSCFRQHLNRLRELQSQWWVQKPEIKISGHVFNLSIQLRPERFMRELG